MLEVDPAHRSTAKEIQDHPWINVSKDYFKLFDLTQLLKRQLA